ncbi:BUD22-domain-containing protein [Schizophyllum commune H4-8]|uniref:Bud22 domain-containing protein n=1 Tax=Schizophyllum commune (strain H4-8 / FGSC 9210) TaxID=578458 RepID=D8PXH2_SCHCM|nr:BUD22-domain-containing protein [Schizophyllum commune H4-8]KAI5896914.1 BUD22-domain-containing protein [Schizophyllum commune H4-8]
MYRRVSILGHVITSSRKASLCPSSVQGFSGDLDHVNFRTRCEPGEASQDIQYSLDAGILQLQGQKRPASERSVKELLDKAQCSYGYGWGPSGAFSDLALVEGYSPKTGGTDVAHDEDTTLFEIELLQDRKYYTLLLSEGAYRRNPMGVLGRRPAVTLLADGSPDSVPFIVREVRKSERKIVNDVAPGAANCGDGLTPEVYMYPVPYVGKGEVENLLPEFDWEATPGGNICVSGISMGAGNKGEVKETHGVKRKRTRPQKQEIPLEVKVAHKIHHDAKEIVKAAKKAKTFETQKLIKKLKGLRQGTAFPRPTPSSHPSQATDYHAVGTTVLQSKIKKDKVLAQHDAVTSALQQELADHLLTPAPAGTPAAKVHARLTSHKALAAEAVSAVQALHTLVQPPASENADDEASDEEEEDAAQRPAAASRPKKEKKVAAPAADSDDEEAAADGWESGTVDEDGDGWESGTVDGGDDAQDSDADDSDSDAEQAPPAKKAKASATPAAASGSSTFLPSLSVGFVRGSDDSDIEEIQDKPKKNRRGQRARRLIWEREYGKNANHKKKERDQAFEKRRQWEERQQKRAAAAAAREERERAQAQEKSRPIHPSWEAKKKLKEKEAAAMVPSQGKKLVFT